MSRVLTGHQVNPVNDTLTITVTDEPGSGGANHCYVIGTGTHEGIDWNRNASLPTDLKYGDTAILFQNGPINIAGVNGVTHEVLLAILIDRMQGFQRGAYASDDNEQALTHMVYAQEALQRRTKARMLRGVEGTLVV